MIERLLDAGVRTLQLRIKDRRMKRWKPMSWRQLRWAAAITPIVYQRLLAAGDQASGVWRPLGQEDLQATDLNAIRAAGLRWAFRHMTIWKSTSRWQHAPLYRAGTCVPDANQTDAFCTAGLEQLARHVERLADYPTVAMAVSVWHARLR